MPKLAIIVGGILLIALLIWHLWSYCLLVFEELKKDNSKASGAVEDKEKSKKEV